MQMRVAYSGLIFRKVSRALHLAVVISVFEKVLRLSSQAMNHFSSGQVTNLLANDAPKVEAVHYCLNYLWVRYEDEH